MTSGVPPIRLTEYCIQIIMLINKLYFLICHDQWGPAHSSYSDPILMTLILSFIQ